MLHRFYSWNDGLVHYLAVNTNLPGNPELWNAQWEWIQADLLATNRTETPWVIAHGHQSMYCSCDGDCDGAATNVRDGPYGNGTFGLEELFFKHGVDLFINGHEHDYERNWPTCADTDPTTRCNFSARVCTPVCLRV